MDYEKTFLSRRDREIMDAVRYGAVVTLHPVDAEYLISLAFIDPYALSNSGNDYVITADGSRYMEFLEAREKAEYEKRKSEKQREKQERFRTWASIIVSNLIAFAALIISIVK